MTSKHFEAFARAIATITDSADGINFQQLVISVAKDLNPRFDEERFKARVKDLREEYLETIKDDGPQLVPGGRVLDTTGLSEYLGGYLRAQLGEKIRPWTKLSEIIKTGIDSWGGIEEVSR